MSLSLITLMACDSGDEVIRMPAEESGQIDTPVPQADASSDEREQAVMDAERACAGESKIIDRVVVDGRAVPPPAGLPDYTWWMLEQANEQFGTEDFEIICAAIPGGRTDQPDGRCFVASY